MQLDAPLRGYHVDIRPQRSGPAPRSRRTVSCELACLAAIAGHSQGQQPPLSFRPASVQSGQIPRTGQRVSREAHHSPDRLTAGARSPVEEAVAVTNGRRLPLGIELQREPKRATAVPASAFRQDGSIRGTSRRTRRRSRSTKPPSSSSCTRLSGRSSSFMAPQLVRITLRLSCRGRLQDR